MAQMENLTPDDVTRFESLTRELQEQNPALTFKTFPQEDLDFAKRLTILEGKVDQIISKLNTIFGDSVLIRGRFQSLSELPGAGNTIPK